LHAPTLNALEFPRIQQELAAHTACQLGRELALNVAPLPSLTLIQQVQQETTEAKSILQAGRSIPFGSIQDVRQHVERAEHGGVLRPDQLLAVADTIYGCRQLHRFLTEQRTVAPLLCRHGAAFGQFDLVEEEIRRCIERGSVSSRASHGLKQVRSEIATLEGRIQDRLNGLLKQYRQHLQEALVTTRGGRYVIPVKASARAQVPGTVHGASASGSTVFVEPQAIAQACEELESWRAMEEAEVEQVLIALSGHVAAHAQGLQLTLGAVAELDLIFARGRLSLAWDGRPVAWNEAGLIDLKGARHPLLGQKAIGNQVRLSAESRVLIVTGPNTGGKTLLLKTLGLLAIIARCGLHVPVEEGSTLCFFEHVFADIGDHQSLEQSLSTFSGHIAGVAPMLAAAGPHTLVLLDELGSGTDPHEGTGLGIALLEAFMQKGAYTLATTHLREIKEFGRQTAGCAYAGMGFDGETLRPTYHLLYGTLGESHALEIAARAGLSPAVVARARALVYGEGAEPTSVPVPGSVVPVSSLAPAAPVAPVLPAPLRPATVAAAYPGVVVAAISPTRCRVWHEGTEREAALPDAVRRLHPAGLVPGDRLRLRDGRPADVANRRSILVSRDADTQVESVVAANLTRLLVVLSCRQPDFHATLLARHLLYAERHGVVPIICLTKTDLVPAAQAEGWIEPFRHTGYEAVLVSAIRGHGIPALRGLLQGQTTAVMGYAGAGKSTLLGALGEEPGYQGNQPRALCLDPETWLIDMPGLRELGVWKPDLGGGFREFSAFTAGCNRPGCLHLQEPGCAVRQAVQHGQVQQGRYEQYLQLLRHMRMA
jgi:putative ribosome biogenesis GTPase RsgA